MVKEIFDEKSIILSFKKLCRFKKIETKLFQLFKYLHITMLVELILKISYSITIWKRTFLGALKLKMLLYIFVNGGPCFHY